jgi:xanthosine utilization system XapX-like protein
MESSQVMSGVMYELLQVFSPSSPVISGTEAATGAIWLVQHDDELQVLKL